MSDGTHVRLNSLSTIRAQKVVGLIFCGALAWFAFADAATHITRDGNARFALRINDSDAIALAVEADRLISQSPKDGRGKRAATLARQSIAEQALNPRALRILSALNQSADPKFSEELLRLSARLSKRDIGTQLWQIEKSIATANIAEALNHYDQAMRTHVESRPLLFPVLAGALEDPEIRRAFTPYVVTAPVWLHDFLVYALGNGTKPQFIAEVILAGKGLPRTAEFREVESLLLWQLASKGDPQAAKTFYLSLPGASAPQLQSLDFTEKSTASAYAPLTWATVNSGTGSGGFAKGNGAETSVLRADVSAGEHVTVARKMLFLSSGSYQLSARVDPSGMVNDASGELVFSCVRDGKASTIWVESLRSPGKNSPMVVTPDCAAQYADIRLYGGDSQSGSELIIQELKLVRTSIARPIATSSTSASR